jgi:hypothetical protein
MVSGKVPTDVGGREVQGIPRVKEGEPMTFDDIQETVRELEDIRAAVKAQLEENTLMLFRADLEVLDHAKLLLRRLSGLAVGAGWVL